MGRFRSKKLSTAEEAKELLEEKKYDEAVKLPEEEHETGKISSDLYYYMGRARYFKGDDKKALA